jgi:8-oxo-dGTP pyrophosphatase MutT (NUDIX family)
MAGSMLTPITSASVIVLRDGPLEVLLLRRSAKSSFVPNAWVFPGGIAEEDDLRLTAVRETFEETGLRLDPDSLVATSRWITPEGIPKRFDTWFYLATVDRNAVVTVDGNEIVDSLWIDPSEALGRGDLHLVFPTIRNLQALSGFSHSDDLLASRRGAIIEAVQPVLVNGKPTLPVPR